MPGISTIAKKLEVTNTTQSEIVYWDCVVPGKEEVKEEGKVDHEGDAEIEDLTGEQGESESQDPSA